MPTVLCRHPWPAESHAGHAIFARCWSAYFEGIDSERGIAWRAADSLAIRRFLGIAVDEAVPDHSTISRTRRLIDVD